MIRRPPRSTLTHSFPTRRSSDLASGGGRLVAALGAIAGLGKSGDKRLLVGLAGHPHFAARRIGSDLGRWIDAQDRIGDRPGAAAACHSRNVEAKHRRFSFWMMSLAEMVLPTMARSRG